MSAGRTGAGPLALRPARVSSNGRRSGCGSARGRQLDRLERTSVASRRPSSAPDDWTASFVTPKEVGAIGSPAPLVRGEFKVSGRGGIGPAVHDRAGHLRSVAQRPPGGRRILAPGWTTYKKRLCYQTFDVTALLAEGTNTLEALLGNGWYRGQLTWLKRRAVYGDRLAYLAQLEVTYSDGSVQRFVTDESWQAAESGVLEDDLYDGQTTDLRAESERPMVRRGDRAMGPARRW